MKDIFKRAQEIDEKGANTNDSFLQDIMAIWRKGAEIIKDKPVEGTFSNDINQFNLKCNEFINYVKNCVEDSDNNYYLFLTRSGNDIEYGRFNSGIREKLNTIKMISPSDFKKIYELIRNEFESIISENTKHTFGAGWSLIPSIGDNVMIEIESINSYDSEWIYDVAHQERGDSKRP